MKWREAHTELRSVPLWPSLQGQFRGYVLKYSSFISLFFFSGEPCSVE